jgi:hypothetical protein
MVKIIVSVSVSVRIGIISNFNPESWNLTWLKNHKENAPAMQHILEVLKK